MDHASDAVDALGAIIEAVCMMHSCWREARAHSKLSIVSDKADVPDARDINAMAGERAQRSQQGQGCSERRDGTTLAKFRLLIELYISRFNLQEYNF